MSAELTSGQAVLPEMGRRAAVDADFDQYVAARYGSLIRTARLLTQDWGLAEDLVQTTLVKCWGAWGNIQANDPAPYVRRVMLNTYFAWWRRSRARPEQLTGHEIHLPGTDRYERVENAEILQALRRLPKRMCAMVVLRYFEGLTEAETAATLGCSVGTVKSQTHRALAHLRVDPTVRAARGKEA